MYIPHYNQTEAIKRLKMSYKTFKRLGLKPTRVLRNFYGGKEYVFEYNVIEEIANNSELRHRQYAPPPDPSPPPDVFPPDELPDELLGGGGWTAKMFR